MTLRQFLKNTRILLDRAIFESRRSPLDFQLPRTAQLMQLEERLMMSASPAAAVAEMLPASVAVEVTAQSAEPSDLPSADVTEAEPLSDQQFLDLLADVFLPEGQSSPASVPGLSAGQPGLPAANSVADAQTLELVFIDPSVGNVDRLIAALQQVTVGNPLRTLELIPLDSRRDGLAQITSSLLRHHDVNALHIVSQGTSGTVPLGSAVLSADTVNRYQTAIQGWQYSIAESSDILIYGCELPDTESGRRLIEQLQQLTGATVAASDAFDSDIFADEVLADASEQSSTIEPGFTPKPSSGVMLSGSMGNWDTASEPHYSDPATAVSNRTEIVFLDTGIQDYEQILADLQSLDAAGTSYTIQQLDSTRDGLQQINAFLTQLERPVDAVHFITHGTDRALKLGSSWIDTAALNARQAEFQQWGQYLNPNADLLFYGCDLAGADSGRGILESIAAWTGADVAASDDATGSALLGGDWQLEYQYGALETHVVTSQRLQSNWQGVVSAFKATIDSGKPADSLHAPHVASASEEEDEILAVSSATQSPGELLSGSTAADLPSHRSRIDVVLIDSQLSDSQDLQSAVNAGVQVVVYDSSIETAGDVLARAVAWLESTNAQVRTLSILSHGAAGGFQLGGTWITDRSISGYASEFQALADYLANDAQIYIYGCDVVSDGLGQGLLDKIAMITQTDVYASSDITGVGGDWVLEASSFSAAAQFGHSFSAVFNREQLESTDVTLAWYNSSWSYRQTVTISETMVTGTSNLSEFSVLVSFTNTNLRSTGNGGNVGQTDGGDLLFTSADGTTKLSHQIESYDATTGTLVAWVRVPTLNFATNTQLYIYYGNAGAADQWNVSGTWNSNIRAVYHLASDYNDSTSNANNGTNNGTTNLSTAKIASGDTFNGSSQNISVSDSNSLDLTGNLTLSAWFNKSSNTSYDTIISKGPTTSAINYYLATSGTELVFGYTIGGNYTEHSTSGLGLVTGTWYQAAVTYHDTANTWVIYLNGNAVASGSTSNSITTNAGSLTIGNSPWGEWFAGSIDEVRIESVTQSADWIRTQYLNQNSPSTFVTVSAQESPATNIVPGAQSTSEDTNRVFSSGNGNQISISDLNAGSSSVEVTVAVTNGVLSLSGVTGLTFVTGDGTNDSTMTFRGTVTNINSALNGLIYSPVANHNGGSTLTITSRDSTLVSLDLDANIQAHYTFESNASDVAPGTAQNGTLTNGATVVTDATRGPVLSLDGINDYVQISGTFSNPTEITIGGWVNLAAGTGRKEFISLSDRVHISFEDGVNGVKGSIQTGAGSWVDLTSGISIAGTGWRHIMYTYSDSANVHKLYIDGVEVATATNSNSIYWTGAGNTFIGSHPSGLNYANALIDDVRIYNRFLSGTEVDSLSNDLALTDTDNIAITVNSVNDAPTITNGATYTLTGTDENTTSSGTLASTMLTGTSWADVDTSALSGLAITAVTGSGTWQYSTDGTTWNGFGAVTSTNALFITSSTQVRYIPNGSNGETATFTYKAWDQTSGTASTNGTASYATTASAGGSAAFSSGTSTALMTISSVNDAPVLDSSGTMTLTTISEDNTTNIGHTVASIIASAGGDRIADADAGAVEGIAITSLNSGNGRWEYSLDGGANWNVAGPVSTASALLLRDSDLVRFFPNEDYGFTAEFTFQAWDRSSGAAGSKVDATVLGGATAFSSASEVASVVVTDVNDAPNNLTFGTVVADYRDDFVTDGPLTPGWQYLWNAPNGWVPGGGNDASNAFGNPANYGSLVDAGTTWTADGNTVFNDDTSARALELSASGGHPGGGAANWGPTDRYVIAAYTVSESGFYSITDSWIQRPHTGLSGNGLVVDYHIDSGAVQNLVYVDRGATVNFDASLGFLSAGQIIYIGVGPSGHSGNDAFNWDFSLRRESPLSVAENSGNGTVVTTMRGLDVDPNSTLSYTITSQGQAGAFEVDANTGVITVANGSLLDFETATSHVVTVRTTDAGGLFTEEALTINLTNVNEAPTALALTGATTGAGSSAVYNVTLDSYYTYVSTTMGWEAAMDNAQSSLLGGVSGTLAVVNSAAETAYLYTLSTITNHIGFSDKLTDGIWIAYQGDTPVFQVWDGSSNGAAVGGNYTNWASGQPNNSGGSESYAVFQGASSQTWNDVAGTLTRGSFVEWSGAAFRAAAGVAGSVMENASAGTVVGTLAATDADAGETYTYSIVGGSSLFEVVGNELRVKSGATFDYETAQQHTLTIRVTDSGNNTRDQAISVNVVNVNEAPTNTGVIGTTNLISNGSFETNTTGWTLTGAGTVRVTGQGATAGSAGLGFSGGNSVNDGIATTTMTTVVGQAYTVTFDMGAYGVGGGINAPQSMNFQIQGASTLINESIADAGTNPNTFNSYRYTFVADSTTTTLRFADTSSVTNSIDIVLDNVQAYAVTTTSPTMSIAENSSNGTVVGQVTSVDPDAYGVLSYSLADNAGGRFAINAATGQITVANGTLLNYEAAASHNITVRTTDQGGLVFDKTVTISLTNVNEAPVFASLNGAPTFVEGGSAVFLDPDVTIADPELSASNNLSGATLTLGRNGGASSDDALAFDGINVTTSGVNVLVGGVTVGTYTFTDGELSVSFGANATNARVNTVMQNIVYGNSSDTPPASVQIDWMFHDGGNSVQAQGGSAQTTTASTTVNITAVNDSPTLSLGAGGGTYYENAPGVFIDTFATVIDADGVDFDGGVLTSWVSNNGTADDILFVRHEGTGVGQVNVSGNNILIDGVTIGSFSGGNGVADPLLVTFNANADAAEVEKVVRQICFLVDSEDPSGLQRTVSMQLTDGDGGTSVIDTRNENVVPLNDAPSGGDNTITINEDATYTFTAADFGFSDVDNDAFDRVWITSLPGQGQLLYNGTTFAANNWVLKSDIDLGLLTFEPATNANGSGYASFTFQVQDDGGTANGGVNRDATSNTITLNVTAQNDAPVLDHGGPYLINEGDSLNLDAGGSTDVDGDTLTYRWDLNNDAMYDITTTSASITPAWSALTSYGIDDDGVYTIGLQVDDGNGGIVTTSSTVMVNNIAPTLTASGAATVGGDATYTLTLADVDPGDDTITSWIVNWGDGSIDTYAGDPSSVTHVYANELAGLTFNISVSAIDEDGQCFEANLLAPAYGGDYVNEYDGVGGTFVRTFAPSSNGILGHANIVLMPNGNYLVSGVDSGNIVQYQPNGTLVGDFVPASSPDLANPGGMAFGPDGNLYVADYGAGNIVRFNGTTGAYIDNFVASGLISPLGLEFGPDRNLYVANRGSAGVLRYDGLTGVLDASFNVSGISGAEDLTFGPDGNIYVGSTSGVIRVNSATGATSTLIANGTGGLTLATGLEFGPDGNLYVADQNANVIRRYNGTTGDYIGNYASGISGPAYLEFTADHRVTITNTNQAPTIAANTGATVAEGSTNNTITTAMLNEGDPDDDGIELTWTITSNVSNGTLKLNGVVIGLDATFTQQDIDDNLLTYDHNGGETASDSFDFTLADGGENGSTPATGTFSFTVTPVNDTPAVTAPAGPLTVTEDAWLGIDGAGFSLSDVDAGSGVLQMTLNVTQGYLTIGQGDSGVGIVSGNITGTVVLSGTVAQLNNLITGGSTGFVRYVPNVDVPNATSTLTITVNDQGNSGTDPGLTANGSSEEDSASVLINVTAANDSPTFVNLDGAPTYTEGGSAVVLDSNVTISDPELNAIGHYNGATLRLVRNGGGNSDDALAFDGTNVTTSGANVVVGGTTVGTYIFSGGQLDVTFNASATQARVNTLLQNIIYWNWSDTPPASVQINWTFNDGNTGTQGTGGALTATGSTTVTITAANDAPVISMPNGGQTYTEGGSPVLFDSAPTVTDTDSANFDTGTLTASISSNASVDDRITIRNQGTGVGQIGVSGSDVTYGGTIIGTWTGGTTGSTPLVVTFNSNATVAAVQALAGNVQFSNVSDTPSEAARIVRIVVTDGDGGTSNAGQNLLNVVATNDEQLIATNSGVTVAENSTGTVITNAMLLTTDVDNTAAQLVYSITSATTNGTLRLNGAALTNGSTFTQADINSGLVTYDHNGTENLTDAFSFSVDDGTGTSSTGTFSITITPVNDNDPTITSNGAGSAASVSVAENSTAVTTVAAMDADLPAQTLTYSITGGDDAGFFTIGSSTGALSFSAAPDFETLADADGDGVYVVTVQVSDGTRTDTQTISVTITDANEGGVSTVVDSNAATDTVAENSANGTPVGVTGLATDPDGTDVVTYSLTNDAGGRFAIDPNTGIVTVAGAIDREAAASYGITIRATSSDTSFTTMNVTISISDVNESPVSTPVDSDVTANSVAENATNGTLVGITASATDSDATTNTVTYDLVDDAGGRFTIHATTGFVTVADGTLLNYEAVTSHNITIRATSSDLSTTTQVMTITLTNVNETPSAGLDTATAVEAGGTSNGTAGTNPIGNVLNNDADPDHSNLLLNTEAFDSLNWSKAGGGNPGTTVTANSGIAPDGTMTADSIDYSTAIMSSQDLVTTVAGNPAGLTYTFSVYVKGNIGETIAIRLDQSGLSGSYQTYILDGTWQRLSVTRTYPADGATTDVHARFGTRDLGTAEGTAKQILAWGAQLEIGSVPTNYKSVGASQLTPAETETITGVAAGVHANASGSVGSSVSGSWGSISIASNGVYTYSVNNNNATVQALRSAGDTLTDTFTYTMTDHGGLTSSAQITITIQGANDEQVIATNTGTTVAENTTGTVITSAMLQTTDVDDAAANLTYTITSVVSHGTLRLNGVALTSGSTFTQAQIDGGLLTYDQSGAESASDSFSFTVDDGTGTSSGGTFAIVVTQVNDAPTISNGHSHSLTSTNEDTASSGTTASTILSAASLDDVDPSAVSGMAITATTGNGDWEYSTDGTTWRSFGAVSATNALLITSTTQFRYSPDLMNGETATFSYKAWDQTNGSASTNATPSYAATATSGGTSAFSSSTASALITVTSVNDSPDMTNGGGYAQPTTTEDTPSTPILVSTILAAENATDVDTGSTLGMAVYAITANSDWQYSTDGTTWTNFGTLPGGHALLLTGSTWVRYLPDGANSEVAYFSFQTWDMTTGAASTDGSPSYVVAFPYGGTTAYSDEVGTSGLVVSAVNDAPVLQDGVTMTITEGPSGVAPLWNAVMTDADTTNFSGGVLTAEITNGAEGTEILYFASVAHLSVLAGDLRYDGVSIGTITGYDSSGPIVVTFNANANYAQVQETYRNISVRLSGDNPSAADRTLEVILTDGQGGTSNTSYSTLHVTTLNDDPSNSGLLPSTVTVTEDVATSIDLSSLNLADPDANAGVLTLRLTTSGGNLTAAAGTGIIIGNNGTNAITLNGTLTNLNNYLNVATNLSYLHPVANTNGTAVDSIAVAINDNGNTSTGGGGGTDIALGLINIDITAVNDTPVLATNTTGAVTEGGTDVITNSELLTTDVDNTAIQLSYSVTSTPTNGFLELSTNPGAAITNFTQEALNAGLVRYVHDSSNTTTDSFTFTVTDGALTIGTYTHNYTMSAVNDAPVVVANSLTISESGTVVLTNADLLTTDPDSPAVQLTYTVSGVTGGQFEFVSNAGAAITTFTQDDVNNGRVQFLHDGNELAPAYDVTVSDGALSDGAYAAAISFTSINDTPVLDDATFTMPENSADGTSVGTVNLTDPDTFDLHSFSIIGGNTGNGFAINATTGEITVNDFTALDFETNPVFALTVRVQDTAGAFDTATITINLTNIDEHDTTTIRDTDGTADTIAENSANGTVVGITAFADDLDQPDTISYSMDDNAGGRFTISAATGVVTVANSSLLNYESATSHNITVRATSTDTSFSTRTFTINLTDVNESPISSITDTNSTTNAVAESAVNGTLVGYTASASDADGTTSTITYTLDNNAGGAFAIDSVTGVVSVANGVLLNREANASLTIIVRATSADLSFTTQSVDISLLDVNEFGISAVSDINAAANSVAELSPQGTLVGITVAASDADATTNTVTYTLDDNAGGRFQINSNTGVVSVGATALDYESSASYSITARSTSADLSFTTVTLTIQLTDANEHPVSLISDVNAAVGLVAENAANGTLVGITAFATDSDGTDTVTYSLDNNAGGRFAIDSLTGVVTVANGSLLNREAAASHNIVVRATSADSSFSTQSFTITLIDVNEFDASPITDTNVALNQVYENATDGSVVGIIANSFDSDATNNGITYTLDDDAGGRFAIDAVTGVITVATGSGLNYESSSSHIIRVRATGDDGSATVLPFTITVRDVNEAPVAGDLVFNGDQANGVIGSSAALFGNSVDPDGDSLSATLLTGPLHGTVVVLPDGSFTYKPQGVFSGVDSFTFTVTDGQFTSGVVTAKLVVAVNLGSSGADTSVPPADHNTETDTDAVVSVDTVLNDRDAGDSETVSVDSPDEDSQQDNTEPESPDGGRSAVISPEARVSADPDAAFTVWAGPVSLSDNSDENVTASSWVASIMLDTVPDAARLGIRAGIQSMHNDVSEAETLWSGIMTWMTPVDAVALPNILTLNNDAFAAVNKQQSGVLIAEGVVLGATTAVSTSVTIGYVVWILRGGSLLTAFMSSLPAWQFFDPLPILNTFDKTKADDETDSLLSIVTGKSPVTGNMPSADELVENAAIVADVAGTTELTPSLTSSDK